MPELRGGGVPSYKAAMQRGALTIGTIHGPKANRRASFDSLVRNLTKLRDRDTGKISAAQHSLEFYCLATL